MRDIRNIGIIFSSIFLVALTFCLVVLIMGSVNKRSFVEEIKSWNGTEKEQTLPDEKEDVNLDKITNNTEVIIYV